MFIKPCPDFNRNITALHSCVNPPIVKPLTIIPVLPIVYVFLPMKKACEFIDKGIITHNFRDFFYGMQFVIMALRFRHGKSKPEEVSYKVKIHRLANPWVD